MPVSYMVTADANIDYVIEDNYITHASVWLGDQTYECLLDRCHVGDVDNRAVS